MTNFWNRVVVLTLPLSLVATGWVMAGCTTADFSLPRLPTSQPAGPESVNQIAAAVANLLQVEVEPDVSGWTGIEVNDALPWSFMPLMAFLMYLSHRRAMWRIQHNGQVKTPPAS